MSAECSAVNIPPGYKQTEVGVIPEDWEIVIAFDACSKIQDGTHFSPRICGNDYFYITSKNIRFGYLDISTASRIDTAQHQVIHRRCDVKRGDLLLTKDGANTGNAALNTLDEEFSLLSSVAFLRFHQSKYCAAYFLQQILTSPGQRQIQDAMAGNAITRLTLEKIKKLRFPVPPTLAEQETIAEALTDADSLIESLEQLITKKRLIKQGAMQELLTGKRRLLGFGEGKGYKQTEVGVIPEDWQVKHLDEIADVIDPHPSHRAPPEVINGIPFVGIGDLNVNGDIIGNKIRNIDPSVFDEHKKRYDLEDELIGLGRVASIGKVVKIKFTGNRYTISPTLGIIRGTWAKRDYLLYALKSKTIADQFNKIMSGSTRSSVGMIVLRKLDIILPSKEDEQTAIAAILSDMDSEINALEEKLVKAHHFKQGMMQELLTGRIRLL